MHASRHATPIDLPERAGRLSPAPVHFVNANAGQLFHSVHGGPATALAGEGVLQPGDTMISLTASSNFPHRKKMSLFMKVNGEMNEPGFVANARPAGSYFESFCSLCRSGASKSHICEVMHINDNEFERFAEMAGLGAY